MQASVRGTSAVFANTVRIADSDTHARKRAGRTSQDSGELGCK
jgi:hypothetical protein